MDITVAEKDVKVLVLVKVAVTKTVEIRSLGRLHLPESAQKMQNTGCKRDVPLVYLRCYVIPLA